MVSLLVRVTVSPTAISMAAGVNWKLAMVMFFDVLVVVDTAVVGVVVVGVAVVGVVDWPHPARNINDAAQIRSESFFMIYGKGIKT